MYKHLTVAFILLLVSAVVTYSLATNLNNDEAEAVRTYRLLIERADGTVETFSFPSVPEIHYGDGVVYVSYEGEFQGQHVFVDLVPIKLAAGDKVIGVDSQPPAALPPGVRTPEALPTPAPIADWPAEAEQ